MTGDDRDLLRATGSDAELGQRLLAPLWTGHWLFRWPLLLAGLGSLGFAAALAYTVITGIGTWGNNIPVAWAFAITNFVWWIGIGHAGTFISAILLISQQRWRTSINRLTEAMTLVALVNAGLFPIAHLGRPWFFYWLVPYPATMGVWPQFRSSLTWDIAAVTTYATVSVLFWYLGLIPDLAAARDAAPTRRRARIYGLFALGWSGSQRQWQRLRAGYVLMAGLATALVVSVHSIVSLDFAIAKEPGWHSTIFPPYFVAGAILSGFAMVAMLIVPLRRWFSWHDVITQKHFDNIGKVLLVTGSIVGYSYLAEAIMAWYAGDPAESYLALRERPFGGISALFWTTVVCNAIVPQLFWVPRLRRHPLTLFLAACAIQVGMWLERFVIVAGSLRTDFLPSAWSGFRPTIVDLALLFGSMSVFVFLFLLFLRWIPAIPIAELKAMRRSLATERVERADAA
jgi:molybdopterin-containing oxidoreductase family membrane subunit